VEHVNKTDFSCYDEFVKKIEAVARQFEGLQKQFPPAYSALKHKGVPLYKLARKGVFIKKPPRDINIKYIKITEIDLPDISFEVACSSGTYIRTLAVDMGTALGCGAHLKALRRVETCGFTVDNAVLLDDVELLYKSGELEKKVIGMSDALPDMNAYVADKEMAERIKDGKILFLENKISVSAKVKIDDSFVKIIDGDNNLLSIMQYEKKINKYNYCCVFHNNVS